MTVNSEGAWDHFNQQEKHKIAFHFNDGSVATYEEGYVAPEVGEQEETAQIADSYPITEVKKDKNWKGEECISTAIKDIAMNFESFKKDLKEMKIDGHVLFEKQIETFEADMSRDLHTFDAGVIALFHEKSTVEISFTDGSTVRYPQGEVEKTMADNYVIRSVEAKKGFLMNKVLSTDIEDMDAKGNQFTSEMASLELNGTLLTKTQLEIVYRTLLSGISSSDEGICKLLIENDGQ